MVMCYREENFIHIICLEEKEDIGGIKPQVKKKEKKKFCLFLKDLITSLAMFE